MERLYKEGRIRAIGVTSFWNERLADLFNCNEVKPAVNQIETNVWNQKWAEEAFMKEQGIQHEAWAPFAEGANHVFSNPLLQQIAQKYGKTTGHGEIIVRPLLALLAVPPQVLAEAELYLRIFLYPQTPFSSANFNGPVYLNQIVHSGNADGTPAWTYVVFPQGTYNRWHSHKRGQILIATDGIGYTQTLGGAVQVMHPGDVVYCPPGVIHWHGTAPGSHFAHIAISPEDNHDVTWYFFPKLEYEKLGF